MSAMIPLKKCARMTQRNRQMRANQVSTFLVYLQCFSKPSHADHDVLELLLVPMKERQKHTNQKHRISYTELEQNLHSNLSEVRWTMSAMKMSKEAPCLLKGNTEESELGFDSRKEGTYCQSMESARANASKHRVLYHNEVRQQLLAKSAEAEAGGASGFCSPVLLFAIPWNTNESSR